MDTTLDLSAIFELETWDSEACNALKTTAFAKTESLDRFQELRSALKKKIEAGEGDVSAHALKLGVCAVLVAEPEEAVARMEKAKDCVERNLYLGAALRELQRYEEAVAAFDQAKAQGHSAIECDCEKAETWVLAKELDRAEEVLNGCAGEGAEVAQWHYTRGRLLHEKGELDEALAEYESALDHEADHPKATFHLAYLADLYGDDEYAMDLYMTCADMPFVHVNALINLSVLHEDRGAFGAAESCLRRVLAVNPNHERARLYMKDVSAAADMYIDEQQLAAQEKRDAVCDIPVTDFELSVRSRNCLKKMNINTLGDLLRTTEAELLAYKNFGETSLREIKVMLMQKGLTLGQNLAEQAGGAAARPTNAAGVNPELLDRPVAAMELNIRSRKCLQRLGIRTIGELINRTEAELLGSRNFGQTSLAEIKSRLQDLGLGLRRVGD